MKTLTPLPRVMVAPNGARRGLRDHANIPLTDDAVVATAIACWDAGADGIHIHIRDAAGVHLIDAARYRAVLDRLEVAVPEMYLQVTSEAAGLYGAAEQQEMMRALKPRYVSVALREMVREAGDWPAATAFYIWAGENDVEVQHIVYTPEELQGFLSAVAAGDIPGSHHLLQFVLGSYDGTKISEPAQISGFTDLLNAAPAPLSFDWMLCAFGAAETACLVATIQAGGKARIGFENSLTNADGTQAATNDARVRELLAHL